MATHRMSIAGFAMNPDTSGKCWPEPATILGTNDVDKSMLFRIDEDGTNGTALTTKVGVYGAFVVPKNYVSTPKIVVIHQTTKTTGDVVWDIDYKPVAAGETLDPASFNTSDTATITVPGTANFSKEISVSLAAEALAVDDTVLFYCARDGVAAGDTLAGASLIREILFEYADA